MYGSFSKLPGGNVAPSRFVKLQTDNTVVHATTGTDQIWGISQPSTRRAPLDGWDDGYAGVSGDGAINIFGPGDDVCLLEMSASCSIGDRLTATTNGKGVATTSDKDSVGAIALQAAAGDTDLIRVKPLRYDISKT